MTVNAHGGRAAKGYLLIALLAGLSLFAAGCAGGAAAPSTEPLPSVTETEYTEPPTETTAPDTVPPIIEGVVDFEIFVGDAIAYRAGVGVVDDRDPDPILEVDTEEVDLSTPGVYTVRYLCTDLSGNQTVVEATVTVKELPEGYVHPDEIYAAADAILAEILTPEMGPREQVQEIYNWARSHVGYSGHSDRTDYEQTAYTVMTQSWGDCYGFFAVCKLFFERLELPNIDVQKVRNHSYDSDHFWSLVSIDGGESYYHFDATPRRTQDRDFCLVTDAELDDYSHRHGNCHNRDKTLYPATPEVAP